MQPLLHLWSLGVEEQFYFAWPLTLVLLFARTKRPWIPVTGIALLSFALNLRLAATNPDAAFYSPLTRLWELLIGGLLAYQAERTRSGATVSRARPESLVPRGARNAVSLLGLVLVAVAAMAFDGSQPFPGWRAAVPVVGTALCIAAGREAWINRVVLAHPIPVFFGLISYPLYLWHWPALALVPVLDIAWSASQERALKLLALGGAVVAAYLTYRWVERPIRREKVGSIGGLCAAMVVPFLAGVGIVVVDWRTHRASNRQQHEIARQLEEIRVHRAGLYRDRRCFLDGDQDEAAFTPECVVEVQSHPGSGTLLWGDSHAAHLAPGIRARGSRAGFAQLSATSCPPILGYSARGRPNCAAHQPVGPGVGAREPARNGPARGELAQLRRLSRGRRDDPRAEGPRNTPGGADRSGDLVPGEGGDRPGSPEHRRARPREDPQHASRATPEGGLGAPVPRRRVPAPSTCPP